MERAIKDVLVGRYTDTGEIFCIRFKLGRPPSPGVLSQNQPPRIVTVFRGDGDSKIPVGTVILTDLELRRGLWVKTFRVSPSDILRNFKSLPEAHQREVDELSRFHKILYKAIIGSGEPTAENSDEIIFFASLPPEVESKKTNLSDWVLDWIVREKDEALAKLKAEGKARAEEQLKNFPRRLPHESMDVDHYENRQQVLEKLFRKEWPRFSKASDELKTAKTPRERVVNEKRVLIAYLTDYKALYGCHPKVSQDEAAKLAQDDYYLILMNEAMNAPNASVDKRDWRLADGWIVKNYYRMNKAELEIAFNREWNPAQKGSTLRKRAERIGLVSALKLGRPEKPNSLPPG
jgi:hypothetical protein